MIASSVSSQYAVALRHIVDNRAGGPLADDPDRRTIVMNGNQDPADVPIRLSRRRFLQLLASAGAAAPLLAACGTAPSTPGAASTAVLATSGPITVNQNVTAAPAAAAPTAAASGSSGGTFTFGRSSDSDNLDPVTQDGNVDIWIFMSIYDQLVRVNDSGTGLEPALAEKWEVSPDGLTYTFHLRKGVVFSDGTPLKASDVKFSIN